MDIPKILHQTWRDARVPDRFAAFAASWKRHHPSWDYRLWTDADLRELVARDLAPFLDRFDAYPHAIQRVDAGRYAVLRACGGLYVDLDFECLRPLDPLLAGRECVVGLEPAEHGRLHGRRRIVGNALMASVPGHPFLEAVLDDLATHESRELERNNRILDTTGPFMLSRVLDRYAAANRVTLIGSETLYPLSILELEEIARSGWTAALRRKLDRASAVHHHAGTWWRS